MNSAARQSPAVANSVTMVDDSHIGVTIEPSIYSTTSYLGLAIAYILRAYSGCLAAMPNYNGYLRIGIASGSKIVGAFRTSAWEIRSAMASNTMDRLYLNMRSQGQSITYYYGDGWGTVTKDVIGPNGERLSASVGDWL
jgi:hypothetical protein